MKVQKVLESILLFFVQLGDPESLRDHQVSQRPLGALIKYNLK